MDQAFGTVVEALAAMNAPWWSLFLLAVVGMVLKWGPNFIRAVNDMVKTQRQISHRHREAMRKFDNSAEQKRLASPTKARRSPAAGTAAPQKPGPGGRR